MTPAEWRRRQIVRQQERAESWRADLDRLLAGAGREIITPKVIEAAKAGRIGDAVAALGLPSLGPVERWLRGIAKAGWRVGLKDGAAAVATMRDDGSFAEPTDEEIRARVTASRRRAGLPPLDLPRDVVADSIYLEEARRAIRGFRAATAEMLREAAAADREADKAARARQDAGYMLALAERMRRGNVDAVREAKATYSGVTSVALDVDWTTAQAGQLARTRVEPGVAAYQWITAADEAVTCVCGFLQGNTILVSDPELMFFAPRLHWNCRCALAPRRLGVKSITWDVVRSVVVRERDGRKHSIRAAPRWVDVPQGKPNQPPPEECEDWIHGRRPTPPEVGRLVDDGGTIRKMSPAALEREFERQARAREGEAVRAILETRRTPPPPAAGQPGGARTRPRQPPRRPVPSAPPPPSLAAPPAPISPQMPRQEPVGGRVEDVVPAVYERLREAAHSRRVAIPELVRASGLPAAQVHAWLLAEVRAGRAEISEHDHPYEVPPADRELVLPWEPPGGGRALPLGGYYFVQLGR